MELSEFVEQSLVQIVRGIEAANNTLEPNTEKARQPFMLHYSGGDRPQAPHIEFDVAVTTQSAISGDAKGKAKLFVAGVELGGAVASSKENVSHVKFSVMVKQHQG
jgi:hypothetical protein